MALTTIACRVPGSVVAQLDELSGATGLSRSQLMAIAVGEYLGNNRGRNLASAIADLALRLEALEKRHVALAQLVAMGGPQG